MPEESRQVPCQSENLLPGRGANKAIPDYIIVQVSKTRSFMAISLFETQCIDVQ
jgi:hypothetical protein